MLGVHALLQSSSHEDAQAAPENAPLTNGFTNGHVEDETKSPAEVNDGDHATSPSASINIAEYKPRVTSDGTWLVSEIDCEFLATGCSVLACGGGGPGYNCYLAARAALRQGKQMRVVDISSLPDETLVFGTSTYGYVCSSSLTWESGANSFQRSRRGL